MESLPQNKPQSENELPKHLETTFNEEEFRKMDIIDIKESIQIDQVMMLEMKDYINEMNNKFEVSCMAAQTLELKKKDV